eukprot:2782139-Amphidinium_carterae.1
MNLRTPLTIQGSQQLTMTVKTFKAMVQVLYLGRVVTDVYNQGMGLKKILTARYSGCDSMCNPAQTAHTQVHSISSGSVLSTSNASKSCGEVKEQL